MSFSYISIFFYWTAVVLPWERLKLSPKTELSLLPYTNTLPTTTGSSKYNLVVSFHVNHIFYKCFIAMTHFFQFIIYDPTLGTAKTQPTDWTWPLTLHQRLDNINRQRRVYFCGEFLGPLHFLWIFHSYVAKFFHLNCCGPNMGMAKTQPTDWVWPPALHHCLANINRQQWVHFEG